MPSRNLYPPTVDSYQAAFDATTDNCKVYFSLSKFSTSASSINAIQLSITNQATGTSVVNKSISNEENNIFASTGIIIINRESKYFYTAESGNDNLYYIEIPNAWILNNWQAGKIYKVQIRLSEVAYSPKKDKLQATWLSNSTASFSEWSTYTILKAVGVSRIQLSNPNWDSEEATDSNTTMNIQYSSTTLELQGEYSNTDPSETLYCYEVNIYDSTDTNLLASSGKLYQNKTVKSNKLYYLCPYELTKNSQYVIHIKILTINKYEKEYSIPVVASWVAKDICEVSLISVEHDSPKIMRKISTKEEENEEGRVALKIYTATPTPTSNNFIIRRAESTDGFKKWADIKIINCNNQDPNELDIIYDYTIESGIYYKYGIQTFKNNLRGIFNVDNTIMIRRDFEYSYLLGDNCQQLKLKFDNTMENFTPNVSDTKTDTIGGKYPFITRNGNMDYRSFPVNGLISFHMDDQHTFVQRKELFYDDDIIDNYNLEVENIFPGYINAETGSIEETETFRWDSHGNDNVISSKYAASTGTPSSSWVYDYDGNFYDTLYERLFREEAIDFLKNDKPKLFKSPTEGNIIVRLTDVKLTPNQSLGRLVYSFTSTAYEIMEPTLENYKSLGINVEGEILEKFVTKEFHVGQYILENYDLSQGEPDLIDLIYEKYDKTKYNMVDTTRTLTRICNLSLYFNYIPTLITNNQGTITTGYNINLNGEQITIYANRPQYYTIDETIELLPNSSTLKILAGNNPYGTNPEGSNNKVTIVANFLYELEISNYVAHITKSYSQTTGLGQIVGNFDADTNLYTLIYNKYYLNWPATADRADNQMRYLNTLSWAHLEAQPDAVFQIRDAADTKSGEQHRINLTGILNLEDLTDTFYHIIYLGIWDDTTKQIRKVSTDITLDYYYELITEVY